MAKNFSKFFQRLQRIYSYILWLIFDPSKEIIDEEKIKKVLIVNLGFIGDLLATTPMIAALARKFGKVDVLIREDMSEALSLNPNVRRLITYTDNFDRNLANVKNGNYDLAVIVWPASLEISNLIRRAKIPYRIGTTQTGLLEGKGYFLTRKVKPSFHAKHKVEENLDIARLVGAENKNPKIEFYFSRKDEQIVSTILRRNKANKFIILHPGKRGKFYAEYSWSLENFAEVANFLISKGFHVVVTGSKDEQRIADEIISSITNKKKVINLTGKLTLKQFGALLKHSELLISIDTASVHMASAFSIPTVVLNVKYPEIWHPWMSKEKYKILISPSASEVIKISLDLIKK
ncbi:MAG: glycosyltransferase family 9 protein [Nanoarchaeota archaeon]